MYQPGGRLSFASGMTTLREKLLGVPMTHVAISGKKGLKSMGHLFPGGLQEEQYIARSGDTFEPNSFRRHMGTNNRLLDPSVSLRDLVDSGEIDVMDVGGIATARAHMEQEDKDSTLEDRPLLEGPITLRYKKFVNGVWNGQYRDVVIAGYPNDLLTKKKHWYIYSEPGMSKSTTTRLELVQIYRGAFIQHPRNATNIPRNAQFLVIDEYGHKRKISMEEVKALTGGDASVSFLNRKFFGQSFVPMPHAQFIFLSNHSIYSVYAKKVPGRGLVIASTDLQALDERFHIIRLDGSDLEERLKYCHAKDLTRHQFAEKLYTILYYRNRMLNATNQLCKKAVRDDLQKCYNLWLDRNEHKNQNLTTGLWLMYLQSLVHPEDYAVFEAVHRDYCYYAGYQYNTPMVGSTIVHLPACRPPDGYQAPRDAEYVPPPPLRPPPQEDPPRPVITQEEPRPSTSRGPDAQPQPSIFRPWCHTARPPSSPVASTSRAIHPSPVSATTSRANNNAPSPQVHIPNPVLRRPPLQLHQAPCFGQKRSNNASADNEATKRFRPYPPSSSIDYSDGFHPEVDAEFYEMWGGSPTDEGMAELQPESQW